jgi:hypothetical protein
MSPSSPPSAALTMNDLIPLSRGALDDPTIDTVDPAGCTRS